MAMKKGKQKFIRSLVPLRPSTEEAIVVNREIGANAVLLKVCRLCEARDGPFFEIFGQENNTAKKIADLLPFRVEEHDELPHKLCFRCSAKLEELYEFVQKCTKTQESLGHAIGKRVQTKFTSHRSLWEEKLNRSNLTNDDICEAVIKKAMEGIKNISKLKSGDTKLNENQFTDKSLCKISKPYVTDTETQFPENGYKEEEEDIIEIKNTFDIMHHVSIIKVNGVGTLFQCKLCNRNFFKKVVLLSHFCAKRGVAKDYFANKTVLPEVSRSSAVKYINTKIDDLKKQQGLESKNDQIETSVQFMKAEMGGFNKTKSKVTEYKPKSKTSPASKFKQTSSDFAPLTNEVVASVAPVDKNTSMVQCPVESSLNFCYKLAPGPNNTFTLVKANPTEHKEETVNKKQQSFAKKIRFNDEDTHKAESESKQREVLCFEEDFFDNIETESRSSSEVIELSDHSQTETADQPYPVGLFQTVNSKYEEPPVPTLVPFATTAHRQQSYTIGKTGNANKVLISAKSQLQEVEENKSMKIKPSVHKNTLIRESRSAALQDAAHSTDSGFFYFIDRNNLLQSSRANIIQESEISTSKLIHSRCNIIDK